MNKISAESGSVLLLGAISSCVLSCSSGASVSNKSERKPNLVFVFADQWRAEATGYSGNSQVITPNADRLSKESVNFITAIATCPVSSPYRGSLLTGQYPMTNGIFFNDKPLADEAVTIAEVFRDNGYNTAYIGKWHLNGHPRGEERDKHRLMPVPPERRQGFEYWKVLECTHDYNNSIYYDENDVKQKWQGYDAEAQTDTAIAYINRKKDQPFMLFLSWGPPHDPYQTAPERFRNLYSGLKDIELRPNVPDSLAEKAASQIAGYYAHIAALDECLGKLLVAIDEAGIEDNTIFVFTSDHGDMLQSHGQSNKQKPWDESIRVPFLLRFPQKIRKSMEVTIPFGTIDIMPTLLGLSSLPIPDSVEGTDFSSYLLGNCKIDIKAGLIMCPVPFHQWSFANGGREYRGVRTDRYTYARDIRGPWLLFDNERDPYQLNNLINDTGYLEIQKELDEELNRLLKKTGDEFREAEYYMQKWNYDYD